MLPWLYNRRGDDAVEADGDTEMIGQFRRLLGTGTCISYWSGARAAAEECLPDGVRGGPVSTAVRGGR